MASVTIVPFLIPSLWPHSHEHCFYLSDVRHLRCLNKRFNTVILQQCRVPWRMLMLSNLRPSNNTCVAEADVGCRCYWHLFKSLEERLDIILVWPTKPRDNICASQFLRDIIIKLPYCSLTGLHSHQTLVLLSTSGNTPRKDSISMKDQQKGIGALGKN